MRPAFSSRTNNRPERVAPDEAFVLVSWSTVMVFPFVCFLFEPHALAAPVKPGKSRQIVANETADRQLRLLARSHGPSRERRLPLLATPSCARVASVGRSGAGSSLAKRIGPVAQPESNL